MAINAYALTTVARVKSRLNIASGTTTWDALIAELINGATDAIENMAGGRRFALTTYTQQVYSRTKGQRLIPLRHFPVTALSAAQYRAGTPATPSWTDFNTNDYELVEDGSTGVVAVYLEIAGINVLRFTYTAGYTINFTTGHTLPYDVSDLCERMTVKAFKKREAEGKSQESAQEGSISWEKEISAEDKQLIADLARPFFA